MPHNVLKQSFQYCFKNITFFIFVLLLLFLCQCVADMVDTELVGPLAMFVITVGYGLSVTRDIIGGGTRLPKIKPKEIFNLGIKGLIVTGFYITIHSALSLLIALYLNFPDFEIKELILNYRETIYLFRTHDPISFSMFIILSLIVLYIVTFFMELALARLADGGTLKEAFRFSRIKHAIDIIGWRRYTWDYTKIFLSIVFLTFILNYQLPFIIVDDIVDAVLYFLIFVIEFIGIGGIYKIYTNRKSNISK